MNQDILAARRNRAIAILLGLKEREIDVYLPEALQKKLRKTILDQINDLYDFFLDMSKGGDDDNIVLNDLYRAKLDEIHAALIG